jgi:hypothetical protein
LENKYGIHLQPLSELGGDGSPVYAQSCMVRTPSKSQPTRLPISFTIKARELTQVDVGSTFKRTIGPTLMSGQLSGVVCMGEQDSQDKKV